VTNIGVSPRIVHLMQIEQVYCRVK